MEKKLLSFKTASEILGVSRDELTSLEKRGAIPKAHRDKFKRKYYSYEDINEIRDALDIVPLVKQTRIQLFLSFKGGTGKSSISSNYAFHMAELGAKVLAIDLDAQGHLTKCLGYDGFEYDLTLFDILVDKKDITDAIVPTHQPNLFLLPSNIGMSPIDLFLANLSSRELRLRKALENVKTEYDLIVLDASPNIGLLNLNALLAAQDLFIPVSADYLSYHGLKLLFDTLQEIDEDFAYQMENVFVILNRYNASHSICRRSRQSLKNHYGDALLDTTVRQCTKFADASARGIPIFEFERNSKGAKDIHSMVEEIYGLGFEEDDEEITEYTEVEEAA